jgi:hypothetical protein
VEWTLSAQDTRKFLTLLKAANYPSLKPRYIERNLFDGGMSDSELTLKDVHGNLKLYKVSVYGDENGPAPSAYYKFIQFVWEMESKHTPGEKE